PIHQTKFSEAFKYCQSIGKRKKLIEYSEKKENIEIYFREHYENQEGWAVFHPQIDNRKIYSFVDFISLSRFQEIIVYCRKENNWREIYRTNEWPSRRSAKPIF